MQQRYIRKEIWEGLCNTKNKEAKKTIIITQVG